MFSDNNAYIYLERYKKYSDGARVDQVATIYNKHPVAMRDWDSWVIYFFVSANQDFGALDLLYFSWDLMLRTKRA